MSKYILAKHQVGEIVTFIQDTPHLSAKMSYDMQQSGEIPSNQRGLYQKWIEQAFAIFNADLARQFQIVNYGSPYGKPLEMCRKIIDIVEQIKFEEYQNV